MKHYSDEMKHTKPSILKALTIAFLFMSAARLVSQVNYSIPYKIINHSNQSVCVDFTVSCNGGKESSEAKLVFIKPGETYTIPAPFFNRAIFAGDYDVHVQIAGLFGSNVINSKHTRSDYGHGNAMFTTQNYLKPQGIIQWQSTHTDIW